MVRRPTRKGRSGQANLNPERDILCNGGIYENIVIVKQLFYSKSTDGYSLLEVKSGRYRDSDSLLRFILLSYGQLFFR